MNNYTKEDYEYSDDIYEDIITRNPRSRLEFMKDWYFDIVIKLDTLGVPNGEKVILDYLKKFYDFYLYNKHTFEDDEITNDLIEDMEMFENYVYQLSNRKL